MKIRDQSILTIYEALLWLFKLCFLTTMSLKKIGIGSHAQLFLVDSAVIEYNIRPPVCRSLRRVGAPPRRSEKLGDSIQINLEGF